MCNVTHNVTIYTPYWAVEHLATLGAKRFQELCNSDESDNDGGGKG